MIKIIVPARADLDQGLKKTYFDMLFATADNAAHQIDVRLFRGKEAAQLESGAAVTAYFIRYSDNATITLDGTVSDGIASVTLKKACYNKAGAFAVIIKVVEGSVINTVFYGEGTILLSATDTILDEENVVPSIDDLLAQIAVMEQATQEVNDAVNRVHAVEEEVSGIRDTAQEAVAIADGWANADAQAVTVGADEEADVTLTTDEEGHKHLTFSVPHGHKGDPGKDMRVLGTFDTFDTLAAAVTNAVQGDLYNVGTEAPFVMYMWDNGAWVSQGSIGSAGVKLLDVYPVGSIYMSVNSTDPSELFGGWWEQLEDRFLLGAGATYDAGSTGGEAEHKLTVNELPAHNHTIPFFSPSGTDTTTCPSTTSQKYAARATTNTGGSQPHNNMPPYLTVFMWKRIEDQEVAG